MAGYSIGLLCILVFVSHSCSVNNNREVALNKRLRKLEERLEQQDVVNKQQMERIQQLEHECHRQQKTILKQDKAIHLQQKRIQFQKNDIRLTKQALQSLYSNSPLQLYERIVFSTYLYHNVKDFGIDHPLVYNRILTNEGVPYSEHSVMFTCPVDGICGFYFSVQTLGINQIVAKLVIDGVNEVDGISDTRDTDHELQGGNVVGVSLTKGQHVWAANYRWTTNAIQETDVYRFSTFSGFLLNYE